MLQEAISLPGLCLFPLMLPNRLGRKNAWLNLSQTTRGRRSLCTYPSYVFWACYSSSPMWTRRFSSHSVIYILPRFIEIHSSTEERFLQIYSTGQRPGWDLNFFWFQWDSQQSLNSGKSPSWLQHQLLWNSSLSEVESPFRGTIPA